MTPIILRIPASPIPSRRAGGPMARSCSSSRAPRRSDCSRYCANSIGAWAGYCRSYGSIKPTNRPTETPRPSPHWMCWPRSRNMRVSMSPPSACAMPWPSRLNVHGSVSARFTRTRSRLPPCRMVHGFARNPIPPKRSRRRWTKRWIRVSHSVFPRQRATVSSRCNRSVWLPAAD